MSHTETAQLHDLSFSRVFNALVSEVWAAWSDPEQVMQWWGPKGFTAPSVKMDFREGGTSIVSMHSAHMGEFFNTWHYRTITPMRRIEFILNLSDKDGNKIEPEKAGMPADFPQDIHAVITFKELGDSETEMFFTEHNWPEGPLMENAKLGMEQCLDKMAALFAK